MKESCFLPVLMEQRAIYELFLKRAEVISSEYSFFALWGWRRSENAALFFDGGVCWLKNHKGLLTPLVSPDVDFKAKLEERFPGGAVFNDVPEKIVNLFSDIDGVTIDESRDEWEYIYPVAELVALKGTRFSNKRAHIKDFEEKYQYTYQPILPEDFDSIRAFQTEWLRRNASGGCELVCESSAIDEAMLHWDEFPFFGAIIKIGGSIVAFTVAEELSNDVVDIRFEKAFGNEFQGLYQVLNRDFLAHQAASYIWVNREEDMGDEGLRSSKRSYHPAYFDKKYRVSWRGCRD